MSTQLTLYYVSHFQKTLSLSIQLTLQNAKSGFEPTYFQAFPGNAKNNVGSAGSTLFFQFPGNATNNLQKEVPEWGPEESSGISGLVGGSGPGFDPGLIFKSGPKHQIWPDMGLESTVWPDNRSP